MVENKFISRLLFIALMFCIQKQLVVCSHDCDELHHEYITPSGLLVIRSRKDDIFAITMKFMGGRGFVVEATDGRNVVHAVMTQHDRLLSCYISHQLPAVDDLLTTFVGSVYSRKDKECINLHDLVHDIGGKKSTRHKHLFSYSNFQYLLSRCQQQNSLHISQNPGKVLTRSVRERRSVSLILPETRWCGVGNMSTESQMYGNNIGVDLCCQEHDHCAYTIEGFTTKYKLFNYRFHTISHCECDDRFRTCLRATRSEPGDMLGRLYFHVIGMKCFIFQYDTECEERTWWGKCTKQRFTREFHAEIRGPLTYSS